MVKPLPSMSLGGYVSNLELKADLAMANIFASERHQSNLYREQISSLPFIFQSNNGDINGTLIDLQDTLEIYLSRIFDGASVVASEKPNPDDSSNVHISLRIQVIEDGEHYSMERVLMNIKGKYDYLTNINNFGVGLDDA